MWWDVALFTLIFGGFFILRGIAATVVFFLLLDAGDRCPNCDAVTLRVESRGLNRLLPMFRSSWCLDCGWHGLLRSGAVTDPGPVLRSPGAAARPGQPRDGSA